MDKEISVSAGVIVYRRADEGVKFLLLYHGGPYWNFPKGKLAEGERSFRAALREVHEETGLRPRDLRFQNWFRVSDRFVIFTEDRRKVLREVIYYLAETRVAEVRVSSEHEGYGWFLYKDAFRILLAPNLKKNLKKAYDLVHPVRSPPRLRNGIPLSGITSNGVHKRSASRREKSASR